LGSRHYTAYAKNNAQWCHFDDSIVSVGVNQRDVVSSAAYVIYYRRRVNEGQAIEMLKTQLKRSKIIPTSPPFHAPVFPMQPLHHYQKQSPLFHAPVFPIEAPHHYQLQQNRRSFPLQPPLHYQQQQNLQSLSVYKRPQNELISCKCKKTKCSKLYCTCFERKVFCDSLCRCTDCYNTIDNGEIVKKAIDEILDRNPNAFCKKFNSVETRNYGNKGCKCRKSACLKKFCECYRAHIHCSINCQSINCQKIPNHKRKHYYIS